MKYPYVFGFDRWLRALFTYDAMMIWIQYSTFNDYIRLNLFRL